MPRLPRFIDNDFVDIPPLERETPRFSSSAVSREKSSVQERRRLVNGPLAEGQTSPALPDLFRPDAILPSSLDDGDASAYSDISRADDGRRYSPVSRSDRRASSLTGAIAPLSRMLSQGRWLPVFRQPHFALPCVDRHTRREVMFAKRKAGRGHRTRKRRTPYSQFGC